LGEGEGKSKRMNYHSFTLSFSQKERDCPLEYLSHPDRL